MSRRHSWAQDQRMRWIMEVVTIFGFIKREHVAKKFWVSTPQASMDLRAFMRLFPKTIKYDASKRCYVRVEQKRGKRK